MARTPGRTPQIDGSAPLDETTRRQGVVHEQFGAWVLKSVEELKELRPQITPNPEHLSAETAFAVTSHCVQFVDATSAFLSRVGGAEVSVSVKFLWLLGQRDMPVLHTLFRSTNTRKIREAYAPRDNFSYSENTAFKTLLDGWPSVTSFASNDLYGDTLNGRYENSNASWVSFYASTAVVTIPCNEGGTAFPIGFVCADSKLAELSNDHTRMILESASKHLYDVLGLLFPGGQSSVESKATRAKAKRPAALLPCGWEPRGDRLELADRTSQLAFQSALRRIEAIYRNDGSFGGALDQSASESALYAEHSRGEGEIGQSQADLLALAEKSDDPAAKRWLALQKRPTLSEKELRQVVERLEEINPTAARMLSRRAS